MMTLKEGTAAATKTKMKISLMWVVFETFDETMEEYGNLQMVLIINVNSVMGACCSLLACCKLLNVKVLDSRG